MVYETNTFRGVAQIGSALGSGPRGRRFKSCHSDHNKAGQARLALFCYGRSHSICACGLNGSEPLGTKGERTENSTVCCFLKRVTEIRSVAREPADRSEATIFPEGPRRCAKKQGKRGLPCFGMSDLRATQPFPEISTGVAVRAAMRSRAVCATAGSRKSGFL